MRSTRWRTVAMLGVGALVATACNGGGGGGGGTEDGGQGGVITEVGEGEGQVNIVSWVGYVEDGSTDPDVDWVTQFEQQTGCDVENKIAGTSDEMVALMQEGSGFDLVTASGDASLRLVYGGAVQPINIDLIPSYSTVDERLQDAPWHTVDTDGDGTPEHYGVPYQWGSDVLMYNTDVFKGEPPDSWNVVYEEQTLPDGQSNKGRIEAYDGPIALATAAVYLKSARPELGIEDPYALTRKQFEAAVELAVQQRQLVSRYWHDAYIQVDDFTNEGIAASTSWPYQVNLLAEEPVASTIPAEGATGWADTTMMHVNAPHPNCAYKWLEWSLNPKLQGDLAWWFGSVPSVPSACEGNELLGPDGCEVNGIDNFDRTAFWKTPQADCFVPGGPQECVPYAEWVSKYVAVIGGVDPIT
jgi:putative spermidine/putrescine transport system substrate-binding protein